MSKVAILQCADVGPLESLVVMLRTAGYDCYLPGDAVKGELRRIGCHLILNVKDLVRSGSYDQPMPLPEAPLAFMESCALYVDVKAQRNTAAVVKRWPRLEKRVLWYRINGGGRP